MKTLLTILLAIAMMVLPFNLAADSTGLSRDEGGPKEQVWVEVCVAVAVCAVATVAIYTVWKTAHNCDKKQRCPNCSRLLPANATVCPVCGENIPKNPPGAGTQEWTQQLIGTPEDWANFDTFIQTSTDMITWSNAVTVPNYVCRGDIEILQFNTQEEFELWLGANAMTTENVLMVHPFKDHSFYRLAEISR